MSAVPVSWDDRTGQEIAAALMGQRVAPTRPEAFARMAVRHHLAPLLVRAGASSFLPPDVAERLVSATRPHVVLAPVRDRELARVLGGLHGEGIRTLLMKGAHLAHSCYPSAYLRVRTDADLLIRSADVPCTVATLARLGYRRQATQTGGLVLGQMLFDRDDMPGAALDVHWRAASPRLAARLLDLDDLFLRAVPVPALGPHAYGPCGTDALAIACVHQVAHHLGQDRLLWMYDVHLLVESLEDIDADHFVHRSAERKMTRICQAVIGTAAGRFPSPRAAELVRRLGAAGGPEPSAALIEARSPLAAAFQDLRVQPRWSDRLHLAAGHLFPPAAYMRTAYAAGSRAPLLLLYLDRILRGIPRWVRGRPAATP